MNIGIVGLGMIGGSLARAYHRAGAAVLGCDRDRLVTEFAEMADAIDGELDEDHFWQCDLILIATPPAGAVDWLETHAPRLAAHTLVIDCCGIKRTVCETGFRLAAQYGFTYAGGHPMAGVQYGGFKHSSADMFRDAVFALVPADRNDPFFLDRVKHLLQPAGFSRIVVSSAEEHDKVIAFTSQMSHVVSTAFIKSDTALEDGVRVSGSSFRDMTRVATLDADMWTELLMGNRDNLQHELDVLIAELQKYERALADNDAAALWQLLSEGRARKTEVERRCG